MSTTKVKRNELPIQEFIRRQRLRNESISCTSQYPPSFQRVLPTSAPPKKSRQLRSPDQSPWTQHRHLFIALLLCAITFHLLLGTNLQPLRFRTYALTNPDSPPSRLHPLTSLLRPTPPPPPPFSTTNLTNPTYATLAAHSLHHISSLYAPCTTPLHTLSSLRHRTYPAARALAHLHATTATPTNHSDLAPAIHAAHTALLALTHTSARFELHTTLLPSTNIAHILREAAQRLQHQPKPKKNDRLQTACLATTYTRTLDALESRAALLSDLATETQRTVELAQRAMMEACRVLAQRAEATTDLVCKDALAVAWSVVAPRGPGGAAVGDVAGVVAEAGRAAEALMGGLEVVVEEVGRVGEGGDVWGVFLEESGGRCGM